MLNSQKLFTTFLSLCTLSPLSAMEKKSDQYYDLTVYFPVADTNKFNEIKKNGLQVHCASFLLYAPLRAKNYLSYHVRVKECDVYNAEHRIKKDWKSYNDTKLPLATYIELENKGELGWGAQAEVLLSIVDGRIPPKELQFFGGSQEEKSINLVNMNIISTIDLKKSSI